MRNSLPLSVIALVLLYFGFYLQFDWLENRPVSRVNYELIHVGMSLNLIESLMGGPGEKVDVFAGFRPARGVLPDGVSYWRDDLSDSRSWTSDSDTHRIAVFFDSQNRVIGKAYLCTSRVSGARWALDHLPLWTILFAEVAGLLVIAFLIRIWWKGFQRRFEGHSPTLEIPAFLDQKTS